MARKVIRFYSSFIQIISMDLDLKGKKALVCGSTKGLGYACAVELALLGADLVLMARDGQKLEEVIKTLDHSRGQQHEFLDGDERFLQDVQQSGEPPNFDATIHL